MKVGDIVICRTPLWRPFTPQGEMGILLGEINMAKNEGFPEAEYSRVLWFRNSDINLVKSKYLEVAQQ